MKIIPLAIVLVLGSIAGFSQSPAEVKPGSTAAPRASATPPVPRRPPSGFELSEYGVSFQSEPRLIIMMAALEAAGFDPASPGGTPSVFRAQVRKDLADLEPDLRSRLRSFYERNRLPAPATAADQAARYVSLAFALGAPPSLEAPARSDELPTSLLEVLDFAPLVREFYQKSRISEDLVSYTRAYQAEGDRLRKPTAEVVRSVLTYLHTRPITSSIERVLVTAPNAGKKQNAPKNYTTRERPRQFVIVPDLLGAPGAINFRVIGDEYYAVLPEGTDPASSELRRAYLQYVIDPLMLRFNRDIANRREAIKQVLAERTKAGVIVSPDVFLAVSRSLVAAADARYEELTRLEALSSEARVRITNAADDPARRAISSDLQRATAEVQDESIARLAEEYERGAVLAFFFAEQLKGMENSGFDVGNFLVDMISSFDPAKEARRLADHSAVRQRAIAARQARLSARRAATETPVYSAAEARKASFLVKQLAEIEQTLRLKDYRNAETRLKALIADYRGEPRIFFALAQTASLAAADATDEEVQAERLNRALGNYRFAIEASSPETDRAIISRAHEAMGRIYAFMENASEAARAFEAAIVIGDVPGGAYKEAVEGKRKLVQPNK